MGGALTLIYSMLDGLWADQNTRSPLGKSSTIQVLSAVKPALFLPPVLRSMPKKRFDIQAPFEPAGDQPQAIKQLVKNLKAKQEYQTLLGATGTGKTHTIARTIDQIGKPTLVLAHNKTLAAQLCNELREFFPDNSVEYFISYYDYYQPEAYIPVTDTYIQKTSSINDEIDMLRHSATRSLFERKDVIVVASISCIYGLGIPSEYLNASIPLRVGAETNQRQVLRDLASVQYTRNDLENGTRSLSSKR